MKILFSRDEQVHHFKLTGEIQSEDLALFRASMMRFLDTQPEFVVLDLSEITLQVPDIELQGVLTEIRTLASAKALHLQVALTDIEAATATDSLLQSALERQIHSLRAKIEIREEMRRNLEKIIEANSALKSAIDERTQGIEQNGSNRLNPLIDRLWSGK